MMKKKFVSAACCITLAIVAVLFAACSPLGTSLPFTQAKFDERALIESLSAPKENGVVLSENGSVKITIVYDERAETVEKEAALFLAKALSKMTGAEVPIDTEPCDSSAILVGNAPNTFLTQEMLTEVENDGYRILSQGQSIALRGLSADGTANAVYGFLEDELGCMWLTAETDYIPAAPTVILSPLDKVENPDIVWRSVYEYEIMHSPSRIAKLRLSGVGVNDEGRESHRNWGTWCHSSFSFVPPSVYFEDHPEYYCMYRGKRTAVNDYGGDAQLCLSNEDVYRIVRDELAKRMAENPDVEIWDFSLMDFHYVCECDVCKPLNDAEGGGMGTLLPFINRLADEFPDRIISTLAYQASQDAPKTLRPRENVLIKLCAFTGDQAASYANPQSKESHRFHKQLTDWSKICNHLFVWDYTTNFSNLLMPFPNFSVQQANSAFYLQNNVYGVFHQSSREYGGEMADLRAVVLSKLLWDSEADVSEIIAKYVTLYYGREAGKEILAIIQEMSDALYRSGLDLGIYDSPTRHAAGYLSAENVDSYFSHFDKACEAAASDAVVLERLSRYKINLLFAKMYQGGYDFSAKEKAADELFELCQTHGITAMQEIKKSMEEERALYDAYLVKEKGILSGIIIGGIAAVALAVILPILFIKYRRKKHGAAVNSNEIAS